MSIEKLFERLGYDKEGRKQIITPKSEGRPLTAADVREGDTVTLAAKWDEAKPRLWRYTIGPSDTIGSFWRIVSIERPAGPELPTEPDILKFGVESYHDDHGVGYFITADAVEAFVDAARSGLVPAGSEREAAQNAVIDWFEERFGLIYTRAIQDAREYFAPGKGEGPELPAEPGAYVIPYLDAGIVVLAPEGKWIDGRGGEELTPEYVSRSLEIDATHRRLVPAGSEHEAALRDCHEYIETFIGVTEASIFAEHFALGTGGGQ